MTKALRIVRADADDRLSISAQRLTWAIQAVAKAAEMEPIMVPFGQDGTMAWPSMTEFTTRLRDLIEQAMKNEGSLTVRFLGDLKPTTYPLDTQFFRLADNTVDGSEFTKLIQKALLETEAQEVTFVNLATVRDVRIQIGNHRVAGVNADLSFLSTACDIFDQWIRESATVRLSDGET